jgi:hypothetical protein
VITAVSDLAAFERQDRQVGAITKGPDFHAAKIARCRLRGGRSMPSFGLVKGI